jgi:hypothetical protein
LPDQKHAARHGEEQWGEISPVQLQVTRIAPDNFKNLRAILRKAEQFCARGTASNRPVKLNLAFSRQV